MAVVLLVGHLRLGEVIAARVSWFAWLADAATDVTRPGGVLRAAACALIGSGSHVAFDALAHRVIPDRLPRHVFHIRHLTFATHTATQAVATLVGVIVALVLLWQIRAMRVREAPARRPGIWLLVLFTCAGGALGFARSVPAIRHPTWYFDAGPVYVWGYVVFFVVSAGAAGALVAATGLALWDRRAAT
jgi:hypothetical protein